MPPSIQERVLLYKVHCLRMQAHWGKNADTQKNWPQTEEEWRQVEHGSPCDTNVHMAKWHLELARKISTVCIDLKLGRNS